MNQYIYGFVYIYNMYPENVGVIKYEVHAWSGGRRKDYGTALNIRKHCPGKVKVVSVHVSKKQAIIRGMKEAKRRRLPFYESFDKGFRKETVG